MGICCVPGTVQRTPPCRPSNHYVRCRPGCASSPLSEAETSSVRNDKYGVWNQGRRIPNLGSQIPSGL